MFHPERDSNYAWLNMEEEGVPEESREQSVIICGNSPEIIKGLIS